MQQGLRELLLEKENAMATVLVFCAAMAMTSGLLFVYDRM